MEKSGGKIGKKGIRKSTAFRRLNEPMPLGVQDAAIRQLAD
jgi:hypothetical protein